MNLTMSITGELEQEIKKHSEIKWTEIARGAMKKEAEKLKKLKLLEAYLDKKPISDRDWAWMEKHDWHPVDEKPFKKEFIRSLKKAQKEKPIKVKKIKDIWK